MILRQLFDHGSCTYSYLLADPTTGDAVMIDPVLEHHLRDLALMRELGVKLTHVLDTHQHEDHVTGAWWLREHTACKIVASREARVTEADLLVEGGDRIAFGTRTLEVLATPGHTPGCVTYVTAERDMAFAGDSLLIRGAGRTDLGGSDARQLFRSVRQRILSLPRHCLVYPGHDYAGRTVTTVGEERQFNPRLGDAMMEEDFVGTVDHIHLPPPPDLAMALAANLRSGAPRAGQEAQRPPDWGPLVRTYGGPWEVNPLWVAEHLGAVLVVDVRSAAEFHGDTGHIHGAVLAPLADLRDHLGELDTAKPIVVVCRSGARSTRATSLLQDAGFGRVANLAGGMLRWAQLGLPVISRNQAVEAERRPTVRGQEERSKVERPGAPRVAIATQPAGEVFPGTSMPDRDWWQALWPNPEAMMRGLGARPGARALDVCCGDGYFTVPLGRLTAPAETVGVDLDAAALATAAADVSTQAIPNIRLLLADVCDLGRLVQGTFDFVLLASTLHGIPDKRGFIRAIRALMNGPDSRLVVVNWHALSRGASEVMGKPRGPRTDLRMPPLALRHLAAGVGLDEVSFFDVGPYHYAAVFEPTPAI